MIEICFNESFYFFFFFTSVTFIASHSRLSIELKKSYLSPLFRFFKEVNSRGSVDKRQVSFSRVARVISVGTRLYRSTYVQDACELEKLVEQGKGGKECIACLSFHGMGVSLYIVIYALEMGVGESRYHILLRA